MTLSRSSPEAWLTDRRSVDFLPVSHMRSSLRLRPSRVPAALLACALTVGMAPVAFANTADEIARTESELGDLQRRAEALAHRIEENWERQIALELQVAALVAEQAFVELEFATALGDLQKTAVRLYMDVASGEGFSAVLVTNDEMYAAAFQYLSTVAKDSEDAMNRLSAVAADLDRHRTEIEAALANQADIDVALVDLAIEVTEALEAQAARLRELEELRAQEIFLATSTTTAPPTTAAPTTTTTTGALTTTTAAVTTTTEAATTTTEATTTTTTTTTTTPPAVDPPVVGGGACPVDGPVTFVDSWGAPRSGGRAHEGVDMIAARGTPIAAIYSGTIRRTQSSTLGGLTIWLLSDAGDEFFYAHLDSYAAGISGGTKVNEGQTIGYNGSTGNAPDYLPHLHFEYHPGGGSAVNPYPLVKSICG